ncbi:MAG: large conductance mechanosensitive channel [Flavobacteriales bacterium]|jgi:large conductance mechanosensitive channel
MLKEFKKFIMTGNVIDLAVAVMIAAAMGLVITGFVKMVMMPVVGHFTGGADFSEMYYELDPEVVEVKAVEAVEAGVAEDGTPIEAVAKVVAVKGVPANRILYGSWINTIINLLIVGFVLFMIVKATNKAKKKQEAAPVVPPAPPAPTKEEVLLGEIRDLLKK